MPLDYWLGFCYNTCMIAIFRHGQTAANKSQKVQGWTDSPLTETGKGQVEECAKHFLKHFIAGKNLFEKRIFTSSSPRSVTSGVLFSQIIECDTVSECDSLKERHYGNLEGMNIINASWRVFKIDCLSRPFNSIPPKGESLADVYERASLFLDSAQIRIDDPGRVYIFHVHENVSKILRGIFLKLHSAHWLKFSHDHDKYYVIDGNYCQEISTVFYKP